MILVIDNYDSFTYNLVQYLGELGAELYVCRNDEIEVGQVKKLAPAGIVVSPGPGRPEDAGISVQLIKETAGRQPILGVCLGHQALAYAFAGLVVPAPRLMHGKTSMISHDGSRLFKHVPSPFKATRYHSLTVDRVSLPADFVVTAETDDATIMALQHTSMDLFGLQFHPESILTDEGKKILRNFSEICDR